MNLARPAGRAGSLILARRLTGSPRAEQKSGVSSRARPARAVRARRRRCVRTAPALPPPARRRRPADVPRRHPVVVWRRLDAVPDEPLPWCYGAARRCLANHRRGDARRLRLVHHAAAHVEPGAEARARSAVCGRTPDPALDGRPRHPLGRRSRDRPAVGVGAARAVRSRWRSRYPQRRQRRVVRAKRKWRDDSSDGSTADEPTPGHIQSAGAVDDDRKEAHDD